MFVARQRELAQLEAFLNRALDGQGGVCFVAGEPGSGKTTLTQEFIRRSQEAHTDLIAAIGNCNAQTGIGEAYLPFREVLGLLTGDLEAKLAQGAITAEGANRLQKVLARSGLLLLEVGPDLVGAFVPGGKIFATLGRAMAKQIGWDDKLTAAVQHKPTKVALTQASVEQDHIFEQFTNFLIKFAAEHPLLIVLDDLQWVDASSVSLLFHISRRLANVPLLIVGAYRAEEVALGRAGERHPLEKVLNELKRYYGDISVDLDQARATHGREFVDQYLEAHLNCLDESFREALYVHCNGHPLFTVELIRQMEERGDLVQDADGCWSASATLDWANLPARVEGAIEGRLRQLEPQDRELLTYASVEGESFAAEIVAQSQKANDREVVRRLSSELSRHHGLVDAVGVVRLDALRLSRYRFRHSLFQKHLYHSLDEIELAYLHEDVGQALERFYEKRLDEVAVELAWHFSRAGLDDKAAHYHRRAGELAILRYAHDEAVQHLGQALALTPESNARTRCELLLLREEVYGWQGKRSTQLQDLEALVALAGVLNDSSIRAQVALRWAEYSRQTGDYVAATTHVQTAIAQAKEAGDRALEALGYSTFGQVLRNQGQYREAQGWLELALNLAREQGNGSAEVEALNGLSWVACEQGFYEIAASRSEEALATALRIDYRGGKAAALENLYRAAWRRGDLLQATHYATESLALYRVLGDRRGEAAALSGLGILAMQGGRLEEAEGYYEASLAITRAIGEPHGEYRCLNNLGEIARKRGQYAVARDFYEQGIVIARKIGARRSALNGLFNLSLVHVRLGDGAIARDTLRQVLQESVAIGAVPWMLSALALAAQMHADAGRLVQAAELLGSCTSHPAWSLEDAEESQPLLATLRAAMPADEFTRALARGATRHLSPTRDELQTEIPTSQYLSEIEAWALPSEDGSSPG